VFTGIVETVGAIVRVENGAGARRLRVEAPAIASTLTAGDSVSVDGVCLTVERADLAGFEATAVAVTLARTTLGERAAGDAVNLERAATLARFLGGHLVQGHVDAVGRVVELDARRDSPTLVLELPDPVFELCVEKGSIAVDGVSLTIAALRPPRQVAIALVPHTLSHTTFGTYQPDRRVNVETDVIAKYVRQFVRQA
jgi:riboflavin synthase